MSLLIKDKNHYDCKFILILFHQTLTMFQTVACLWKAMNVSLANIVDTDEVPQNVASHLCLQCLLRKKAIFKDR